MASNPQLQMGPNLSKILVDLTLNAYTLFLIAFSPNQIAFKSSGLEEGHVLELGLKVSLQTNECSFSRETCISVAFFPPHLNFNVCFVYF